VAAVARPARRAGLIGGLVLAAVVLALLAPFATADPPAGLTASNAPWTDEGFNLANARERVLTGAFATGDIDRSLTNGAYSAVAAVVFAVRGPDLAAGRAISMVAVAGAVLLLAVGLAEALGALPALLAAAVLAGADLVLEYGRLALVEPLVVLLLTVAFALAVRAPSRPSPWAGAGLGLALAGAISVKAIALLPALAMLAVVLVASLARRDRRALAMGLVGLGVALAAGLVWLLAVALPNLDRLRTGLEIWPRVSYLAAPWTLAERLWRYLAAGSDGAAWRSLPLLAAAVLGLVALAASWRRLAPAARDALLIAGLWGIGLWAVLGAGDYLPTHYVAPNRYVVPALPGLAVLGGFGLAWLSGTLVGRRTGRTTAAGGSARPEAARTAVAGAPARREAARTAVAVGLALAVAVPGTARYLAAAAASGHQRERDQRTLAAALPPRAVVFGAYAPTLLFDTRARLISTWPPASANVDDPVGRFGVSHVLAAGPADPADPTTQVPAFRDLDGRRPLARVEWGGRTVSLYQVGAAAATR
jgi:4-amino-4-deoxy-L-arabinose transferase-like glycosyltransferase